MQQLLLKVIEPYYFAGIESQSVLLEICRRGRNVDDTTTGKSLVVVLPSFKLSSGNGHVGSDLICIPGTGGARDSRSLDIDSEALLHGSLSICEKFELY